MILNSDRSELVGSNYVYVSPQSWKLSGIVPYEERFRGLNAEYFALERRVRSDNFEDGALSFVIGRQEPFDGLVAC